ncbi:MAG: hypothetical protein IJT59_03850 [Desulfovibrionaceae bacterium]|nr:hypothetical protein [Desulfovibrionaceae bacterium]
MSSPKNPYQTFCRIITALLLVLGGLLLQVTDLRASAILAYDQRGDSLPFMPYMEYMLDESGTLDIEAVSLQEKSLQFLPLKPLDLDTKTGTFWLRFTLGPLPEGGQPSEWLLSLGDSFPGDPTLYVPNIQSQTGMQQWSVTQITDRHILKLPPPGPEAKTCYLRLNGPPGLWFAPMLRSPQNAANNWGPLVKPGTLISLAVIMLLALLRSFSEYGQWRVWTALFVGGALAAGYLGLPTVENGHIGFGQFARALAPGFSLMLIPHVARHMMRSSVYSRIVDAQLILLTLVGAVVTLLPLVPGLSWTARFMELWPLGTILFIPTALWALFLGLPRSLVFLFICFLPPLAIVGSFIGLFCGLPVDMLSGAPLAGIALSALLLVATPNPPAPRKDKDSGLELNDDELPPPVDDLSNLELSPTPKRGVKTELPNIDLSEKQPVKLKNSSSDLPKYGPKISDPLEILLEAAQALANSAKQTHLEAQLNDLLLHARSIYKVVHPTESKTKGNEVSNLDLEFFLREIYQQMQKNAFDKGLTFGWSIAPGSNQTYKGQIEPLQHTVKLLVESAVNATKKGGVYLTASQTLRNSVSWLTFSISDTGASGPNSRSPLAILRALEVAGNLGGEVEFKSKNNGTQIKLSVPLEAIAIETKAPNPIPRLVICSENVSVRHSLRANLSSLNLRTAEATSLEEAYALSKNDPPCLLVAHDTQATPSATGIINQFKKLAREKGLPFCKILAITANDSQWKELGKAGFTYALLEPVDTEALITTVANVQKDFLKQLAQKKDAIEPKTEVPPFLGEKNPTLAPTLDKLTQLPAILEKLFSLSQEELAYAINYVKSKDDLTKREPTTLSQPKKTALDQTKSQDDEKAAPNPTLTKTSPVKNAASGHFSKHIGTNNSKSAQVEPGIGKTPRKTAGNDVLSAQSQGPLTPKDPTPERSAHTSKNDYAPLDEDEWVGEPVPVTSSKPTQPEKAKPSPAKTSPSTPQGTWFGQDEWVGEPTPIVTPKEKSKETEPLADNLANIKSSAQNTQHNPSSSSTLEPINYAEGWADDWVGEPIPILNGAKIDTKELNAIKAEISKATSDSPTNQAAEEALMIIKEMDAEAYKAQDAVQKAANDSKDLPDNSPYEEEPLPKNQADGTPPIVIRPEVMEFLDRVDLAINDAKQALAGKQCMRVAEAVKRVAQDCDALGFRRLAKMARCVERAGKAGDLSALNDLLPELIRKVDDNRLTLSQFDEKG